MLRWVPRGDSAKYVSGFVVRNTQSGHIAASSTRAVPRQPAGGDVLRGFAVAMLAVRAPTHG